MKKTGRTKTLQDLKREAIRTVYLKSLGEEFQRAREESRKRTSEAMIEIANVFMLIACFLVIYFLLLISFISEFAIYHFFLVTLDVGLGVTCFILLLNLLVWFMAIQNIYSMLNKYGTTKKRKRK